MILTEGKLNPQFRVGVRNLLVALQEGTLRLLNEQRFQEVRTQLITHLGKSKDPGLRTLPNRLTRQPTELKALLI